MNYCQSDDPQIRAQREISQIQNIKPSSSLHLLQVTCISELDLAQRSDTRFHTTQIFEARIKLRQFLSEISSFRSRSDNGHGALKHIEELRGLIQFVSSHESPPRGNPGVIRDRELWNFSFGTLDHASEFVHGKDAPVSPNPALPVNNRSAGADIGKNCQEDIKGQKADDEGRGQDQVQDSFAHEIQTNALKLR